MLIKLFLSPLLFLFFTTSAVACEGCIIAEAVAAENMASVGRGVYLRYCTGCHGEKGDGKGKGSTLLVIKPRDLTSGIFKFKSTQMGSLPTDEDLIHTIINGLPGSSMPAFPLLPESEIRSVIAYIKTFSERWKKEKLQTPIFLPAAPVFMNTADSVLKGRELYIANGCNICHGDSGDGKGPAAEGMADTWSNPCRPRNFKRGIYRSGAKPKDLFKILSAGIEGTPMPAFTYISEEERWHLISYLLSLKAGKK